MSCVREHDDPSNAATGRRRVASDEVLPFRSTTPTGVAYWRSSESAPATPVVFLHGLGADHEGLAPVVAELSGVDAVAPDLPGYGLSAPLPAGNTVLNYADIVDEVRRDLGVPSMVVVGHSLGANIALAYAGLYPDRVAALALLHPVTAGIGPLAFLARAYYRAACWLPERLARAWLLSRPAVFLADAVTIHTRDRDRRRQILDMDYRAAALASPRAIGEAYQSLARTPFRDLAARIVAPTMLLTGGQDHLARPESVTALHDVIAGSTMRVIDGGGHLWPVEDPRAAAELLAGIMPR
jgi:pimeloyl-ACP methyl ester carboxylesterase